MNAISVPRYIPINRNQKVLQPLNIEKLISADHPARKIWSLVGQLREFEGVRREFGDRAKAPG